MTRRKHLLLTGCLSMLLAAGCNVHELPDEFAVGGDFEDVTLSVDLTFNYALPQYQIIDQTRGREPRIAGKAYPYVARYTVWAFAVDRQGNLSDEPAFVHTEYRDEVEDLSGRIQLRMSAQRYKVFVWTDFVEAVTHEGFYDISDPRRITVPTPYAGAEDFHDAFRGELDLDFTAIRRSGSHIYKEIPMSRPLGKFNVVSTDRQDFATRLAREVAQATPDTKAEEIDLSLFNIRFRYVGYMPDTFDLTQDAAVDARLGSSFSTNILELDDKEVELGFDYIFINGEESTIDVAIEIYNNQGDLLSTVSGLHIPIVRSKLTTVRGAFLTGGVQPGVTIDAGFDGDITVHI